MRSRMTDEDCSPIIYPHTLCYGLEKSSHWDGPLSHLPKRGRWYCKNLADTCTNSSYAGSEGSTRLIDGPG